MELLLRGADTLDGDADHTIAWDEGGTTSLGNLAHLCRRHHTLKHATAWTVSQPVPGELRWRSPLGHTYIDRPPPIEPTLSKRRPPPDTQVQPTEDRWGDPNNTGGAAF